MIVLAIGVSLKDVGFACLGTLLKYIRQGSQARMLLTSGRVPKKAVNAVEKAGVRIHLVGRFDYSEVTQDNVNALRSVVEELKPALVFIPSINACDKKRRVVARSAFLACRSVGNVLTYETDRKNKDLRPSVHSIIAGEVRAKNKALAAGAKRQSSRLHGQVERFESHRVLLNDAF